MARAPGTVALLDSIMAHSPVGLGFWDLELRLRHANAALLDLMGVPAAAAVLGSQPSAVLGPLGGELEHLIVGVIATEEPVVPHSIYAPTTTGSVARREWIGAYYPVFGDDGGLIGVAGLIREGRDERGSSADLQRALQVAIVARTEAETARMRTAFVAQASASMATSMDADQALRQLARAAVPDAADWCTISMVGRDGRLDSVAAAHHDPEHESLLRTMTARRPLHVDDPVGPAQALRERRALLFATVGDDELRAIAGDAEHLAHLRELGMTSMLIAPLMAGDRALGALSFVYAGSGRRYGAEDIGMAEALAAWAALHVENARLYTERSAIAATLQEGLLPSRLPTLPGLELAARYRPAGNENAVGGDFYDVFERPDGGWSVIVGDVSGKGADAAALTALARHTIFAGALQGGDGESNLRLLNAALLRRSGLEGFCTAVAIDVAPRGAGAATVELTLVNGGHPTPLVLRADGTVQETVASGMLIGAVEDVAFRGERIALGPGDALVLYTDGATELRGPDPHTGARTLRAVLAREAGADAAGLSLALERALVAAAGGELRDDLALLVLRAPA